MIRTMLAMSLGLGPGVDATKDNVNKPATIHIRTAASIKMRGLSVTGFQRLPLNDAAKRHME
jgi:hypothetical protein